MLIAIYFSFKQIVGSHDNLALSSSRVLDDGSSLYNARRLLKRMQTLRAKVQESLTVM